MVEYVDHYAPVRARRDPESARAIRLLTSDQPARTKRTTWNLLANA